MKKRSKADGLERALQRIEELGRRVEALEARPYVLQPIVVPAQQPVTPFPSIEPHSPYWRAPFSTTTIGELSTDGLPPVFTF